MADCPVCNLYNPKPSINNAYFFRLTMTQWPPKTQKEFSGGGGNNNMSGSEEAGGKH